MARYDDTFRMNPVSLCALIGGLVTFMLIGAIVDVLWVAIGAGVGAGAGYLIRRYGQQARTFADAVDLTESSTREQLYEEAKQLEIDGRSTMNRDELATAVAERRAGSPASDTPAK